jgi:hypothetical protein
MTVRWITAAPAAAEAAAAWLLDKSLAQFHSRAALADEHRGHPDAVLFEQPGAVSFETPFSSVTLPHAGRRRLRASLPTTIPMAASNRRLHALAQGAADKRGCLGQARRLDRIGDIAFGGAADPYELSPQPALSARPG